MNLKKISLILPLTLTLSLLGCGETTSSSSDDSSSLSTETIVTTSDNVTSSLDSSTSEELSVNTICDGTPGGRLLDIDVNSFVTSNSQYNCSFSMDSTNPSLTFRVSNSNIISINVETSINGQFVLITKNAGDAVLEIFDSNEMLVYRNIVRVRDSIGDTEEEISEYLYSVDKFVSIYDSLMQGHYELTFLSAKTEIEDPTGFLEGYDDYDTAGSEYNFTYSADETLPYDSSRDCYWFNITTTSTTSSSTTLYSFSISRAGDMLMVYYLTGGEGVLLTMLVREDLLYLHTF